MVGSCNKFWLSCFVSLPCSTPKLAISFMLLVLICLYDFTIRWFYSIFYYLSACDESLQALYEQRIFIAGEL
ncbi:MAG TPA: hypothetical protein DEO86_18970 [Colwellia sp.]|nr:hypothetical protein [Colwellia sp.]